MSTKPKYPVCANCHSSDIEFRELKSWDVKEQKWEVFDTSFYCSECEHDEIKWRRS